MAYMQCYRPAEQDPCYQQAKPHSAAGIYDTFHHTNQQQHHQNAHGYAHTNSAATATPTSPPTAKTHSNSNVSGYNNHKYGQQHGHGTGFVSSTGHPAHHGSQTTSSAIGCFKSEKKMKEKYSSSEYKKKSSGHKKNKNKCGNDSGSDSSSGSDSD
ncbi:hypothetical protein LINGRAHAP2_LOCUS25472 [Linum grandiflorum]